MKTLLVLFFLLLPTFVFAQEPVNRPVDLATWGTAFVNPVIGVAQALRSDAPKCRLLRLSVSELIGNVATITLKHVIASPRPCLGCAPDGMPSGHTMNSFIGSSGWRYGFVFGIATGQGRRDAHRHTVPQVLAGAAIGIGAEFAGKLLRCE